MGSLQNGKSGLAGSNHPGSGPELTCSWPRELGPFVASESNQWRIVLWKKVWLCGDKGEIRSPLHPSCCPNKAPANEEAIPCRPHGPAAAKVSQIRPLQRESDRQQYNQDNGFDRRWSLRERAPTMFNVVNS